MASNPRNIKKSDVVWHCADNATETASTFHGYYGAKRISVIGSYTGEAHDGNSALCNKKMGMSEDGESFIPIEQIEPHPLDEKDVCGRCLAIYNKLEP